MSSTKVDSQQMMQDRTQSIELLTDRELLRSVRNLELDIKRIKAENDIFVNFLNANEPALIERMDKTLSKIQELQMRTQSSTATAMPSELKITAHDTQSAMSKSLDDRLLKTKGPKINISSRTDLLLREMEDIQTNLKHFIQKVHLQKNRLVAEIEESGIRDAELKEARNNFEQIVVIEGVEALTQKIPAEKFVRYMQEWLKFAQIMLEKLRLRTSSLLTQYNKLKLQLQQKIDMGVCVHIVDFEQLHIANKNFQLAIDQKNKNLVELKQMAGKANFMLTAHKNFLQKQQTTLDELNERMDKTYSDFDRLDDDYNKTTEALDKHREKHDELVKVTSRYTVPDVMEYIVKKSELCELRKTLKIVSRKVKIQRMAMATYTRTMCQLTGKGKPDLTWFESTISTPDSLSVIEEAKRMPSFIHEGSFLKYYYSYQNE